MRRALSLLLLCAACVPTLADTDSVVDTTRIVAVRADPAEAAPGTRVTLTALVASPMGSLPGAAITWSFCEAPTPLTTDDAVSTACFGDGPFMPAGDGATTTTAATPRNGCALFGPDTPPGGLRPRDPDVTGGYYQPVILKLAGADATVEMARIRCDLANASAASAAAFAMAYQANQNPTLEPLSATVAGVPTSFAEVHAGARVSFTASWPAASAETYAYYDASTDTVTTQREAMRVAWYATDGAFDSESTGRADDDLATTTTDAWTAPATAETVHLFVVLRDSRGGVDFASYDVAVDP